MSDSSDPTTTRASDDDWVKGVVARALLAESGSNSDTQASAAPAGRTEVGASFDQANPASAGNWPTATRLDTASIRERAAEAAERTRRIAAASARSGPANQAPVAPAPGAQPTAQTPVAPSLPSTGRNPVTPAPVTPPLDVSRGPLAPGVAVPPAYTVPPATVPTQETVPTDNLRTARTPVVFPVDVPAADPQASTMTPSQGVPDVSVPDVSAPVTPAAAASVTAPAPAPAPENTADLFADLFDSGQTATALREQTPIEPGRVDPGFAVGESPSTGVHPADEVMVEGEISTEGYRSSDLRTIFEWLLVIASALAVALLIKAFVLQAFWIPSASMQTTVDIGDRILVNKVSYRLHEVRRGDLVVFRNIEGSPSDTDDLIKRAIGLPGETVELRDDGRLWIWGPGEGPGDALLLNEPYLEPGNALLSPPSSSDPVSGDIWNERCTNNRTPGRCTLDDSSFFMLGDNRVSSRDSRFFGPVPEDNIVGRAFLRIWPLGDISTL